MRIRDLCDPPHAIGSSLRGRSGAVRSISSSRRRLGAKRASGNRPGSMQATTCSLCAYQGGRVPPRRRLRDASDDGSRRPRGRRAAHTSSESLLRAAWVPALSRSCPSGTPGAGMTTEGVLPGVLPLRSGSLEEPAQEIRRGSTPRDGTLWRTPSMVIAAEYSRQRMKIKVDVTAGAQRAARRAPSSPRSRGPARAARGRGRPRRRPGASTAASAGPTAPGAAVRAGTR